MLGCTGKGLADVGHACSPMEARFWKRPAGKRESEHRQEIARESEEKAREAPLRFRPVNSWSW
jgi:hypothetical protein